ncbi:MAG: pilus assembly protein PilM [Candidatus Omnitrophica bacterium]|nr:pilus assembly protein PilM [Candidatus Omnitrophota bacterium]
MEDQGKEKKGGGQTAADRKPVPAKPVQRSLRVLPGCRSVVSLDSQWFKLVYTLPGPQGRVIHRFFAESITGLSDAQIAKLLAEKLGRSAGFDPGRVTIANPSQFTTIRLTDLPSVDPAEIRQIVDLQAERYTPYAKEEILAGFKIVGQGKTGYSHVLIAISHRDVVQRTVSVLDSIGWMAVHVGADLEGLVNWFRLVKAGKGAGFTEKTVVLVDVDWNNSTVVVLQGGQPVFHRSIECGAAHLAADAVAGTATLTGELQRSLEALEGEEGVLPPSEIVLSGLAERRPALQTDLQRDLKLPVTIVSTFSKPIPIHGSAASQPNTARVSFSGLIGLALGSTDVDLTPQPVKLRLAFESRSRALVMLGGQLVVLLLLLTCWGLEKMIKVERYAARIERQELAIRANARGLAKALDQIGVVQDRLTMRGKLLEVTSAVTKVLPPEIRLESIAFTANESVILKGVSSELPKVYELTNGLGKLPDFSSVTARRTAKRREGEQSVTDFEIECLLNVPGKGASP